MASLDRASAQDSPHATTSVDLLNLVRSELQTMRYGQLVMIVQDGVVVQIDRTDRKRLERRERKPS